ncbi:MAG: L,D-transpeptidase, partial [Lysobacteraceae bacterium]
LNPGKDFATAGDIIVVPDVTATVALPKGAKVVVDKSDSTVTLLDAAGKTLAQYPASTGSVHDSLPIGTWKIQGVAKNPTFHYNPALFWDADPKNAKATLPAGPNNPVGVVWIDLSKPHYGIHGTPEPSKIGKTESHGCIRLTNWDASELSQAVSPGMPAILQE